MKNVLLVILFCLLFLIIFAITIPFKLISMLWNFESINEYESNVTESGCDYIDSIANVVITILHHHEL